MKFQASLVAVCVSALMIANLGCGGGGVTVVKSATPEDAFSNFKSAVQKDDWRTACGCLTSDSLDEFAGSLAAMGKMISTMSLTMPPGMAEMPPEAKGQMKQLIETGKKFEDVLSKYSISDEMVGEVNPGQAPGASTLQVIGSKIKNKPGFISSMVTAINSMNSEGAPSVDFGKATLSEVKTDGDKATATMTLDGRGQPVVFKKVDGSWLIHLSMN